ncbi:hypothetical protein HC256_007363 [Beauveria bassiana]|nr:hypothetical protein HC256_007363 [Beauveria bassiana]
MVDWGLDLTRCLDPGDKSSSNTLRELMRDFNRYRAIHEFVVAKNLDQDIGDCWLLPSYKNDLRYLLWIDGKVQREDVQTLDEIGLPLMNIISRNYVINLQLLNNSRSTESWRQLSMLI